MNSLRRCTACFTVFFVSLVMAQQSNNNSVPSRVWNAVSARGSAESTSPGIGKAREGDAAYTIGCSASASLGIPACGELPSGEKTVEDQNAADASAAIAAVQKLQQQAGDVSATATAALDAPQDDSADTSAAMAALKKLKQSADDLNAATPDAFAVTEPYQHESGPDEKVPAYTFGQRALAWGIEGIPGQETQNTPPPETSAKTPSEDTASDDMAQPDEDSNRYQNAVQQFQQALDQMNNLMYQQATRNPAPLRPLPSGPQLKKGATPTTGPDCGPGRCQ